MTNAAKKWLKDHNATAVESDSSTFGMFDETIPLGKWDVMIKGEKVTCREILQANPWSSGPMLFTCLELESENGFKAQIKKWDEDPDLLEQQFDYESGRFWV